MSTTYLLYVQTIVWFLKCKIHNLPLGLNNTSLPYRRVILDDILNLAPLSVMIFSMIPASRVTGKSPDRNPALILSCLVLNR